MAQNIYLNVILLHYLGNKDYFIYNIS